MKHLFNLFTVIFLLSVTIVGCDEDDENTDKNFFKVGDTEYELVSGALENYGQDEGEDQDLVYDGYNIDLTLCSKGVNITTDEEGDMHCTGEGQILYFEIFTTSGNALDNGEYIFDGTSPFPTGTFDVGLYLTDWDEDNEDHDWIEFTTGILMVSKNGDEYEITISGTDDNTNIITGYYKGTLSYFNYDSDEKSNK